MVNPILGKVRYLWNYLIIWALIAVAHILIVHLFYDIEILIASADSLIFNSLFCGLGLAYWYPVKYSNIDSQNFITIFINHFAASVLAIGAWLFFAEYITRLQNYTSNCRQLM